MNYNILIDNKMFSADKDSIDKLIHKIYLLHKYIENEAIISIIIIDSEEVQNYIIENILNFNKQINIYDMLLNKTNNLDELNYLIKNKQTCIINTKKYLDIDNRKNLYSSLNMIRDNIFLKMKCKTTFIFDSNEFDIFNSIADDLVSYSHIFDFNSLFYNDNSNINDYNLDKKIKKK